MLKKFINKFEMEDFIKKLTVKPRIQEQLVMDIKSGLLIRQWIVEWE